MEYNQEKLASRVDDIEKTIGDIAQVLEALKKALEEMVPPTCPPYCDHNVKGEFADYKDNLSMEDRVADIRKCIGDTGRVFAVLRGALQKMAPPNCPPYCCHEFQDWKGQEL